MTTNYVVGHNMPGYLPESDPWITTDWETARDALLEDMERHADSLTDLPDVRSGDDLDELDDLERAIDDLHKAPVGTEWGWTVGNTAYWLSFTDEQPDEEEE